MESIPQVILQALAIAATEAANPSVGQYISIAWSALNIAHTFGSVTFSLDQHPKTRKVHPNYTGFIKDSKENAMHAALGLFSLGYVSSKLIAISVLGLSLIHI